MLKSLRRGAFATFAALVLASAAHAQGADPNKLFPDSKVVVRDRFSDEIVGKGPDLVFIPGLASSRATWKATAERLRGRYRLHLIQIAGFAGEPARANAHGAVLVPTAEAIDAYLVQQKLTPAVAIGHSLGGTTLLYLCESHPNDFRKVLIVDALPFFGGMQDPKATAESVRPQAEQMRLAMAAPAGKPVTADQLEPQMRGMSKDKATQHLVAEWSAVSDRAVVAQAMYDDLTLDLRPGLGSIRTPILLLHPDNVPVGAPAGLMDRIYTALYAPAPTVKTKIVAQSEHFVMLDQPQVFATELDAFLAQP